MLRGAAYTLHYILVIFIRNINRINNIAYIDKILSMMKSK